MSDPDIDALLDELIDRDREEARAGAQARELAVFFGGAPTGRHRGPLALVRSFDRAGCAEMWR